MFYQKALLVAFLLVVCVFFFLPPVYKLKSEVRLKEWNSYTVEDGFVLGDKTSEWIPLESISHHLVFALVAAEDARFFRHYGVDWTEVFQSLEKNFHQRKYARGASTITQQVVRLAFLGREKTLLRKLREALGAVVTEWFLTKDEILAWYCNLAYFGGKVYGVKAAATSFFETSPEILSVAESIHLALILPSPNIWSEGLRRSELTDFGRKRFKNILQRMLDADYITLSQYKQTLATGNFGGPIDWAGKLSHHPRNG